LIARALQAFWEGLMIMDFNPVETKRISGLKNIGEAYP
jgi:hypothetical protein